MSAHANGKANGQTNGVPLAAMLSVDRRIGPTNRWYFQPPGGRGHYTIDGLSFVCGILLPLPSPWSVHRDLGTIPLCRTCQARVAALPSLSRKDSDP